MTTATKIFKPQALIMMLYNFKTQTYHPILYFEKLLPGGEEADINQQIVRYKSKGHHTTGYADREDAIHHIESDLIHRTTNLGYAVSVELDTDVAWDGEGIPADVQTRPRPAKMELIHFGNKLDSSIEQNIHMDERAPFGYKAIVVYRADSIWSQPARAAQPEKNIKNGKLVEIYNNCTHIHNRFPTPDKKTEGRIAFESDTHHTGLHRSIDDLESVTLLAWDKKEEEF